MKLVMKLFDIMNDMKNIFVQQIEQYQKNGYEICINLLIGKRKGNQIEIDWSMMNKIYLIFDLIID